MLDNCSSAQKALVSRFFHRSTLLPFSFYIYVELLRDRARLRLSFHQNVCDLQFCSLCFNMMQMVKLTHPPALNQSGYGDRQTCLNSTCSTYLLLRKLLVSTGKQKVRLAWNFLSHSCRFKVQKNYLAQFYRKASLKKARELLIIVSEMRSYNNFSPQEILQF